jgi:hypothetical protein
MAARGDVVARPGRGGSDRGHGAAARGGDDDAPPAEECLPHRSALPRLNIKRARKSEDLHRAGMATPQMMADGHARALAINAFGSGSCQPSVRKSEDQLGVDCGDLRDQVLMPTRGGFAPSSPAILITSINNITVGKMSAACRVNQA